MKKLLIYAIFITTTLNLSAKEPLSENLLHEFSPSSSIEVGVNQELSEMLIDENRNNSDQNFSVNCIQEINSKSMEKEEVKWLKDILRINSTLGNEKEVADYLEKLLKAEGIDAKQIEYADGRNQVLATLKGNSPGKKIGFTGHLDVVPVGSNPWKHDPFGGEEEDGKIYGRGACDMKSGLMAIVATMIQIKRSNLPFAGDIELLATVGEETSSIGAKQLVKLGYGHDLDALVIAEPTDNGVVIAHKGALWLGFKTKGKTAHGSMPSMGVNAVEHMLIFLNAFRERFNFSQHIDEMVGASTTSINVINGGKGTNVIPDECTAQIDIRTIATQNHEEIMDEIKALQKELTEKVPNFDLEIEVISDLNSVSTDEQDPFVLLVTEAIEKNKNQPIKPIGVTGCTDGAEFVKVEKEFPIVVVGPGETKMAHQPDEYVTIDSYLQSIAIYKDIISEFLK